MQINLKINKTKRINAEEVIKDIEVRGISSTAHIYLSGIKYIGRKVYIGIYKNRKTIGNCYYVLDIVEGTLKPYSQSRTHINIPKKYIGYKAIIVIGRR